jgi:hypothetical protein
MAIQNPKNELIFSLSKELEILGQWLVGFLFAWGFDSAWENIGR